ncbi:Hermansky-Pudlak syndrome 5 protein isoform X1 [Osmerus mordax]|uniref:Hermansky-Pudlak syndrome 5 protein isoform X1 n=1 Tax=Osmerus mordax TaxID=8014 RepID=UPI0035106BEF
MVPVVSESHSHVLAEFDCLDPLLSALRLDSGRLKCTCLAVSRKWLAIGTSSGGLHLIQREGWKQRLILTHKEGSITQVACCPHDEDFIAVATSQGLVVVWELQLERRGRPERVSVSWEHQAQAITSLCWDTTALRVFVGDAGGKVSFLRAGSSKLGKGSAFVIFPVQTITTVDSRVVQLGYADGRLLVSSLSRCYLCDTERQKFWRVGNKERDGEYGACFFPQSRVLASGQAPLLYCARPGSRIWEASFSGEVLSTHQFKQLLACPPVPLISYRTEPQYNPVQRSPQSMAFPKLLCLGDQHLLAWTDSAIYIFTPQTGQVLLWSEVKDVVEVAVYRSELFCLYGDGHLSHLSLLSAERCVERLLRREAWVAAASVCCMFQHTIAPSRVRKSIPVDRLDHLRSQLSSSTHSDLIGQLEEVISKLEPLDSASSSRRSSISSHESFNVLDCGIYRVISRRGSQSDEETSSLVSQSMLEEERLKEFSFGQEEDQVDHDHQSSEHVEGERSEPSLQFHLPLSFRPKPPRIALQAVRDRRIVRRASLASEGHCQRLHLNLRPCLPLSVTSFVKKTTDKINTLQMNSDIWLRPDHREGAGQAELAPSTAPLPEEPEHEVSVSQPNTENDLQELRTATERAVFQIQDPLVLLDPACLGEALEEWVPVLERVLGPSVEGHLGVEGCERVHPECEDQSPSLEKPPADEGEENERPEDSPASGEEGHQRSDHLRPEGGGEEVPVTSNGAPSEPVLVRPPKPLPSDLQAQLGRLATLFVETRCFRGPLKHPGVATFMRRYFFLLDQERVRRMCVLSFHEHPELQSSFMEAMLELTQSNKVVEVIHKGDLLKSLRSLRELQPWSAPHLLAHLHRLYEKHGEVAVRSFTQFYPTILPSDVMAMAQPSHFLAYLDNLVQSRAEEQRSAFLGSLLQPESLRQDWLQLALSHDAPQQSDTLTSDGHPRWHSHFFSWGYGRFLSLLIRLPADLDSKQIMAETCRRNGYWTGYLYLCCELQRRSEAFSAICRLDDLSLLEEPKGVVPQTLDEWKTVIQMSQQCSRPLDQAQACAGSSLANGSADSSNQVSPESLTLRLARVVGPDRALAVLQECGVEVELRPHSALVCELLRVAEKRQRALIQTMLERCDRFLWSQPA